jgi:probable F420-dependent oxidoreductase
VNGVFGKHGVFGERSRIGVWLPLHMKGFASINEERRLAERVEELGYGSLWSGETVGGREAFAHYGVLLAATERLVVGTGLAEAYPGRFVLGLGVGYAAQAERLGQSFGQPVKGMRDYLDQLDAETKAGSAPGEEPAFPRVLAALGPKLLDLARERTDGAHPFLSPLEHTAFARERLGPGKLLIPHQAVVVESDPDAARARVRSLFGLAGSTEGSAYLRNLARFGYETGAGFIDQLIDALVAWGDESAIAGRVKAQLAAGADHVLLHPIAPDIPGTLEQLERLAVLLED